MSAESPEWLTPDEGETVEWVGEPELVSKSGEFLTGIVLLVFGVGLVIILHAYLRIEHTDYVVTSQSLYAKRGILSTNIQSVEHDKIQNTEYSQSFVEKLLGYGTVGFATAGTGGVELEFEAIADAREVQETVRELAKQYRDASGESADRAETADPLADLGDELARTREALENVDEAVSSVLAARQGGSGERGAGPTDGGDAGPTDDGGAGASDDDETGLFDDGRDRARDGSGERNGSPTSGGTADRNRD